MVTASNITNQYMVLAITDAAANLVASDYDIPSITVNYTPSVSGTYYIGVSFLSTFTTGSYNFTVSCPSATPPPTQCTYTGTLSIGSTITGQLTADDAACGYSASYGKAYRLPVTAGDSFEVDYSSSSFQPYIEIKGPDTSSSYRWTTSPVMSLATFYVAPTTGSVTIYAMSNNGSPVAGPFTLKVLPFTQPPCGKTRAVRH